MNLPGELLDAGPAALNQNDQHDGTYNSGYDPDQSCVVHLILLSITSVNS
jgi:hypothetical protein